ncbi:uncharacterized protein JCM6883_006811 [Sporobolomyces salmoneus]|uniref:uncharacterized protein n=1 Tax=Sporobolomyces salmoneus TaxID=183962 RepID=UPI003178509E
MSNCTGCLCINRTRSDDDQQHAYEPISTDPNPRSDQEIMILSDKQALVNLSLTERGLVVVKRKPGAMHSLKLGNPSSSSTRLIPYLSLLSFSLSTDSKSYLTIQALVPTKKDDENSKMRLWKLSGKVQPLHDEGGKGLAKKVYEQHVRPVLEAAKVSYQLTYTGPRGSPNHAVTLGQTHDSTKFDSLIAVSGDGIIHELLNGLATHSSGKGKKALRESPVTHVPCGSGNALATSIVGNEKVGDWKYCTLVGLKGRPMEIDLCSVTQKGGKRVFSFLTQAFGLMADLDLGTEHLRFLGDLRFTLGYVQGALTRKRYPMKLKVLVEDSSKASIARKYNKSLASSSVSTPSSATRQGEDDDLIPELEFGYPDEPLLQEIEREMKAKRTIDHLPKDGELDGGGKWWTLDLLSDKKGVFFLYGGKMPWISKDVMLFPPASPNNGLLDLCLVAPMSPLEALTAMDSAETGSLFHHPSLLYLQTRAYRLEFPHSRDGDDKKKEMGFVSIDGEKLKHEDFAVEVHKGLGRVMALEGRLMGSKPIEGV